MRRLKLMRTAEGGGGPTTSALDWMVDSTAGNVGPARPAEVRSLASTRVTTSVIKGSNLGLRVFWLECTVLLNIKIGDSVLPGCLAGGAVRYSAHTETWGKLK